MSRPVAALLAREDFKAAALACRRGRCCAPGANRVLRLYRAQHADSADALKPISSQPFRLPVPRRKSPAYTEGGVPSCSAAYTKHPRIMHLPLVGPPPESTRPSLSPTLSTARRWSSPRRWTARTPPSTATARSMPVPLTARTRTTEPLLYRGNVSCGLGPGYNRKTIEALWTPDMAEHSEGYVVRLAAKIAFAAWGTAAAKFVRPRSHPNRRALVPRAGRA